MELRHLKYFVAVAEELHFGRAAERLFIAQSALSQQIQSLEAELEVPLFERTKRWVRLTSAGQALLEDARDILLSVEQAVRRSRRVARGEVGQLRIGFTILALHSVLPELLKTFRDRYPDVTLTLSEISTRHQIEALRANQIDLGFLHPPIDEPSLAVHPLKEETMVVALPETHALVRRKLLTAKLLSSSPLIIHPRHEGPVLYDCILRLYQRSSCQPNIVQEATTSPTRIGLVAAGIGVTFVPASLCHLNYAGVVYKHLRGAAPRLTYAVAWQRDRPSPLVEAFVAQLRLV
jgi:DNA-binding transcriptional LysR family regulator